MDVNFRPVPKPKSKPKEKPKYKEKRPKKKKNPNLYRGRIIPSQKERTRITAENYKKMVEVFGDYCLLCGYVPVEAHHIVFRSQMGSGNWRNLAPLCKRCHHMAHQLKTFAEQLREDRAAIYGPWFHADKYTLFKEGLIPNTEDKTFDKFMQQEEKKAKEVQNKL
jgi:5-methylcytosine-specific restriction endonuclease McrA